LLESGKRRKSKKHGVEAEEDSRKKMRTTFTGRQIFDLEKAFEAKKYLSSSERAEMASALNVTQQQVAKGLKKNLSVRKQQSYESRQILKNFKI
jgi:hypothetical protein